MKTCIINSSPKINSVTLRFAKEFCRELGSEFSTINLRELDIRSCTGCMKCYHGTKCIINDDLDRILEEIKLSDLVVFASPTYLFNMSSLMKVFTDRLANWGYKSPLCGKPSVIVSTADGTGTRDCIRAIKKFAYFTGSLPICSLYCRLYEFRNKKKIGFRKNKCIEKIKDFSAAKKYKPGFEYLFYFNLKKSYITTARQRYFDEYDYWLKNQAGNVHFYAVNGYKINISIIKKIFSRLVSFFLFFDYKFSRLIRIKIKKRKAS